MSSRAARRYPIGAEPTSNGGASFRVWAPGRTKVSVVFDGSSREERLQAEEGGYWSATVAECPIGTRYSFRLDGGERTYPDPASRCQPEGPHGPSMVVDPFRYRYRHAAPSVDARGRVVYEMHVGTFTPEGTWAAAARELRWLKDLGINTIEMMPVAEWPGTFGWGYDGVNLYAPTRLYGEPDDLRRFIDEAHGLGIAVVLDVVYNHLGPDGNYLREFSKLYFTRRYENEWGDALDFDGKGSEPVREFFIQNARYWIDEFQFDGLRLDATQSIHDTGTPHVVQELVAAARAAAGSRSIWVVAENEPQHSHLAKPPAQGGHGIDALWNDDFHHTAMVAATGRREAYYTDYTGTPQEFVSSLKWGFLYQGQYYVWQKKRRGVPAFGLPASTFVLFLQNHDQVANSAHGLRLHQLTSAAMFRTLTALLLLAPGTPMLFQGQEFGASSPFLYFADHNPELAALVKKGRGEFLMQFPSIASPTMCERLADPGARATFERSKLHLEERETNTAIVALHRDLLRLRREDPVFAAQNADLLHGAVLGPKAFCLRWLGQRGDDRLVLVNFDHDLPMSPAPEPLLAPPSGKQWRVLWSSEDPCYGGEGAPPFQDPGTWTVQGHSLLVLGTEEAAAPPPAKVAVSPQPK